MEQIFNKLVRDKIISIIENNHETPIYRVLDDKEYKIQLERKLLEEYKEVLESTGKDRIDELADMLEIMKKISELEGYDLDIVINRMNDKRVKRGAFEKKIYLEKTIKNNEL